MRKTIAVAPFQPKNRGTNKHILNIVDTPEQREKYINFFKSMVPYQQKLKNIPIKASPDDPVTPGWVNGWMPGMDSLALYGFVSQTNPEIYFEIGSGNSTKFVHRAIKDNNLRTKIISVDPNPRRHLKVYEEHVTIPSDSHALLAKQLLAR